MTRRHPTFSHTIEPRSEDGPVRVEQRISKMMHGINYNYTTRCVHRDDKDERCKRLIYRTKHTVSDHCIDHTVRAIRTNEPNTPNLSLIHISEPTRPY